MCRMTDVQNVLILGEVNKSDIEEIERGIESGFYNALEDGYHLIRVCNKAFTDYIGSNEITKNLLGRVVEAQLSDGTPLGQYIPMYKNGKQVYFRSRDIYKIDDTLSKKVKRFIRKHITIRRVA